MFVIGVYESALPVVRIGVFGVVGFGWRLICLDVSGGIVSSFVVAFDWEWGTSEDCPIIAVTGHCGRVVVAAILEL